MREDLGVSQPSVLKIEYGVEAVEYGVKISLGSGEVTDPGEVRNASSVGVGYDSEPGDLE